VRPGDWLRRRREPEHIRLPAGMRTHGYSEEQIKSAVDSMCFHLFPRTSARTVVILEAMRWSTDLVEWADGLEDLRLRSAWHTCIDIHVRRLRAEMALRDDQEKKETLFRTMPAPPSSIWPRWLR
jgi:hypothetical protein